MLSAKRLPRTTAGVDIPTLWYATGNPPDDIHKGASITSIMAELGASTIPWWNICSAIEDDLKLLSLAGGDLYIGYDDFIGEFVEIRIAEEPHLTCIFRNTLVEGYSAVSINPSIAGAYALIGTGEPVGLFTLEEAFKEWH